MVRKGAELRNGSVLILVLLVVALLTLSSYTYFDLMFNEQQGSRYHGQSLQARAIAESGVEYLKFFLSQTEAWQEEEGGHFENTQGLRGVLIADGVDATERGRVTVVASHMDQGIPRDIRFGLEDESARLNLNTLLILDTIQQGAAREALMELPGMTESIADAILDWLDPDMTPRQLGAEVEYYSTLEPPYAPKNGQLETIEQLLLVRDVTPALLFGYDTNRNGLVDEHERTEQPLAENVANEDGAMDRGWSAYLTIHSAESMLNSEGQARINVNSENLSELHSAIEAAVDREAANFIIAYRQGNESQSAELGKPATSIVIDFNAEPRRSIRSLLDLVDIKVGLPQGGSNRPIVFASPYTSNSRDMAYLPKLMENLTVHSGKMIPGRININQASRAVLRGIPGLELSDVESVLGSRISNVTSSHPERKHATWLLSEGLVDLAGMKKLMPLLTGGGDVYRAQFVGYFEAEGPVSRLEVILDATQEPRVVYRRDLSDLGPGYTREFLGVNTSSSGG